MRRDVLVETVKTVFQERVVSQKKGPRIASDRALGVFFPILLKDIVCSERGFEQVLLLFQGHDATGLRDATAASLADFLVQHVRLFCLAEGPGSCSLCATWHLLLGVLRVSKKTLV